MGHKFSMCVPGGGRGEQRLASIIADSGGGRIIHTPEDCNDYWAFVRKHDAFFAAISFGVQWRWLRWWIHAEGRYNHKMFAYDNSEVNHLLDLLDTEISPIRRNEIASAVLTTAKSDYALIEIGNAMDYVLSRHFIDWGELDGVGALLMHLHLMSIVPRPK